MKAKEIEFEYSDDEYKTLLREIYGDRITVCGMEMDPADVLERMDPTAYRCGKVDMEAEHDSRWECSECGAEFDDEDEAQACCQTACDVCGNLYENPDDAHDCCTTDEDEDESIDN